MSLALCPVAGGRASRLFSHVSFLLQGVAFLPAVTNFLTMSTDQTPPDPKSEAAPLPQDVPLPPEIGGAPGPEPTRYGDWAHKGRCTDF